MSASLQDHPYAESIFFARLHSLNLNSLFPSGAEFNDIPGTFYKLISCRLNMLVLQIGVFYIYLLVYTIPTYLRRISIKSVTKEVLEFSLPISFIQTQIFSLL